MAFKDEKELAQILSQGSETKWLIENAGVAFVFSCGPSSSETNVAVIRFPQEGFIFLEAIASLISAKVAAQRKYIKADSDYRINISSYIENNQLFVEFSVEFFFLSEQSIYLTIAFDVKAKLIFLNIVAKTGRIMIMLGSRDQYHNMLNAIHLTLNSSQIEKLQELLAITK